MPFRSLNIEHPSELHVHNNVLEIEQDGATYKIPLEDLYMLVVSGPGIRMSTMAQELLAGQNITVVHMGRNHHPAAMTIPMVSNARQAKVAHMQATLSQKEKDALWLNVGPKTDQRSTIKTLGRFMGARRIIRVWPIPARCEPREARWIPCVSGPAR